MSNRERFRAVMNFQEFDRLPILEWAGWWDKTINRWYDEGLPKSLTSREDIASHFGIDIVVKDTVRPRGPDCPYPSVEGAGRIKDEKDYDRMLDVLFPEYDMRIAEKLLLAQQNNDALMWYSFEGFFWFPRTMLGIEEHLFSFYDQPELMHRMNQDLAEYTLKTFEKIFSVGLPDMVFIAEDLSYNNGPMLSKECFDGFLKPYYEQIVPLFKKYDVPLLVDSDGDITNLASWYLDLNIMGLTPLERQSGLDLAVVREQHPEIQLIGGFDKTTMHRGEAAMREEFERLLPIAAQGGFVITCDHQTPPEVSYADYQLYVKLFQEYAEKAANQHSTTSSKHN